MRDSDPKNTPRFDNELFTASVQSAAMENAAAYAVRGRRLSHLTNDELLQGWVDAMRAFLCSPGSSERRRTENDYKAELDIRGIPAPFDAVSAEMEALSSRILGALQKLERDDPQRASTLADQMQSYASAPAGERH